MRGVIYVRVSTDNIGQKTSIPAQIALLKNYLEEQGWELVEIYIDIESGSKTNRQGIQQLMKDAKDKKSLMSYFQKNYLVFLEMELFLTNFIIF